MLFPKNKIPEQACDFQDKTKFYTQSLDAKHVQTHDLPLLDSIPNVSCDSYLSNVHVNNNSKSNLFVKF